MQVKRGSVGWTATNLTAEHLKRQADNLVSKLHHEGREIEDPDFTLIAIFALDYWGVLSPAEKPEGANVKSILLDWPKGKNLPPDKVRRELFEWIVVKLRERASKIEKLLAGVVDMDVSF